MHHAVPENCILLDRLDRVFLGCPQFFRAGFKLETSQEDSALVRSIFDEVLANGEAHELLRVLCKDIGHRLSGSSGADRAMVWGREAMDQFGADTTYIMPVEVPAWTRGDLAEAEAYRPDGTTMPLRITALGGSVPTPKDQWVEGPLLVVRHLDALDTLDARGHIVLFNRAMDPSAHQHRRRVRRGV